MAQPNSESNISIKNTSNYTPASPISISGRVDQDGLTISEQSDIADISHRKTVIKWMLGIFSGLNIFVVGLIIYLARHDANLIDRLLQQSTSSDVKVDWSTIPQKIDSKVLIALIGGTAVQVGTVIVAMTGYLFPKR